MRKRKCRGGNKYSGFVAYIVSLESPRKIDAHYFGISKIALKTISQVWRHWMVTAARKPVHVLIAFGEAIAIKFMLVWKIALKSTLWLLSELGCH